MSATGRPASAFRRTASRIGLASSLIALAVSVVPAADIGLDGGITLTVSFEDGGDDCGFTRPPVDDAFAQTHYCGILDEFSRELYYTTEGHHWIKRVRFLEDAEFADVTWRYVTKECTNDDSPCDERCNLGTNHGRGCGDDGDCPGGSCVVTGGCTMQQCGACPVNSTGSWNTWSLTYEEKGFTAGNNPYLPSRVSQSVLAALLHHEFGHFFYDLPDEYVNWNDYRGGGSGICAQTYVDNSAGGNESDGVICDEQEWQPECQNSPCIFKNQCVGQEEGKKCTDDGECAGAGGKCLGANPNRDDKLSDSTKRICRAETALSAAPMGVQEDEVCSMRGSDPFRRRWCDHSNHVFTDPDNGHYFIGSTVEYDLGNAFGAPTPALEKDESFTDHSCWDGAAVHRKDLENIHVDGVYTDIAAIGLPPPLDCQWYVDGLGNGANPALLVDRSGSMAYLDASNPGVPAVESAFDAALYFYNKVPNDNFAGVYQFNLATNPATNGATSLAFAKKLSDEDAIDTTGANGDTSIGGAIQTATVDIVGAIGVPNSTRDIVLFSDGRHNDVNPANNPYTSAKIACDLGIHVHTIAFGNADAIALRDIALCGKSWATGTENASDPGYEEPDPLELKTSIARMGHAISKETEVLEARALLEPLTVSTLEEQPFVVPDGAESLTFSWLANRTCVHPDPTPGVCLPVLNLLTTVEIESPTGVLFSAGLTPAEERGVYRKIVVPAPEGGIWTARIDKTEPMPPPSVIAGEWETKVADTRVSWVAHVDHAEIAADAWAHPRRAPLDMPVTILARFDWGRPMTRMAVTATVTHAGQSWTVPLLDDGESGDAGVFDGLYGGRFNPDGTFANVTPGPYRVKVRMEVTAGTSRRVDAGEEGDAGEPNPAYYLVPQRGDAVVEAETSFHLSNRYGTGPDGEPSVGTVLLSCPNLQLGNTYPGLPLFVDGIPLDAGTTTINMGRGVELAVDSIDCSGCGDTSVDPGGTIVVTATVDPAAPTGPRDLWVQTGRDWVVAGGVCRICSAPGVEFCNGIDDDCDGVVDEDVGGSVDSDADGVLEVCDNCPFTVNVDQDDFDADGQGDRCDTDDGRAHIVFESGLRLLWDREGGAPTWNVYRGDLSSLRTTGEYTQLPGSTPSADRFCSLADTFFDDPYTPPAGSVAHYLVTSGNGATETSLGPDGIPPGTERPNDNACPSGPPT